MDGVESDTSARGLFRPILEDRDGVKGRFTQISAISDFFQEQPHRVTALTFAPFLGPIPLPKLRVRGTGDTEVSLLPLVDQLGKAIMAAYPKYDAQPISTVNWYEGYNCIENSQNCLGDNRDTPYIPPPASTR